MIDMDYIVIGSGQAGVPLATRLAAAGNDVVLAESRLLGGTCVNYGCTPTKTMIASARAAHVARTAGRLGVSVPQVSVDLESVIARKEDIVAQWRAGVERRLQQAGDKLQVVHGTARFVGEREIEIEGERYRAGTVIINTGARPRVPPVTGLGDVDWLNNETIMQLRQVPSHLVVLGGGYIGCEFGQMFSRFGARVTIVQRSDHLLPREDADVSEAIEAAFRDEGIELRLAAETAEIRRNGQALDLRLADGEALECSHLLVAVGREPNTSALDLESAGVKTDERGAIVVDDGYRTTAEDVYAVGDVTGGPQFTHSSWDDHRRLFDLLMGKGDGGRTDRRVPYTVFTDPQVARVGLSEREADRTGIDYEVASMPFGYVSRALELDETAGIMKVLIDPASERVIGATIVGIEAGELVHIFVTLMQAGGSARSIVEAVFVHPTLAEGVQSLVMSLDRYAL